jgi:integrase
VVELSGLRDRPIIGVMVYSFVRVSAATTMRVEDYFEHGKSAWLQLHEKGGKRHEVPRHHNLNLPQRLDANRENPWGQEGRSSARSGKETKLTENSMAREDVFSDDQTARSRG